MANSFNFLEVKFKELTDNVNVWIKDLYNSSDIKLSPADPYGHILQAVTKIYESSILYLKQVTSQFDINNPNNNNAKMIRALARVGGYNPSRAISATGTISLQLRSGVDITDIGNSELVILNGTKLTNNTNSLDYYLDLGMDMATFKVEKNKKIFLPIVQGKIETQTFTGNGLQNQSYSIVLPNSQSCEQYRVLIKVNGEVWTRVENLNDMLPEQKTWYSKTGIDSGLDIYFGTGNFGFIPPIGSLIEVVYVISDGSLGNLPSKIVDDFIFSDDVYDGFGASVDIAQNFFIFIEDEIGFGANMESVQFTKSIMPFVSRNFVLARPEQFIFTLKRLNIFSQIDAFTTEKETEFDNQDSNDDSVVYLFLVPNISLFITGGNSYFDLDLNAFYLENSEKQKVERWLRTQGIMSVGTSVKVLDPIITKYVINVHLRIFKDAIEENIRASILNNLSNYFANIERRGFIDKSGVISIIDNINGVDSVMVEFISEANEKYHGDFEKYKESVMKNNPNQDPSKIIMQGYEPNKTIGLDPILGDIVYTKNELPIIRGGWTSRDGIYFQETPQNKGLSSVNIIIDGITNKKLF
jgi:hypothetical protein